MHIQEQNCSNIIYTFFPWGNNSLLEYLSVLHQVHPLLLPSTHIHNESFKTCKKTGISAFLNDDAQNRIKTILKNITLNISLILHTYGTWYLKKWKYVLIMPSLSK